MAAQSAKNPVLPEGAEPSDEQRGVLEAARRGDNILCRAVAGAGKTTTLLLLAADAPAERHYLLTYNKRLQLEVSERAARSAPNVEVLTYHSAAGRAYRQVVRDDAAFRQCVAAPPESAARFDVLLLDEAQDMQIEYYVFVRYLLAANPRARIVVVGDELQSISEYSGAHPGFLSEAEALYGEGRPWTSCRLSTSYRLTPATAAFVNAQLYNAPVLVGGNTAAPNLKPIYCAAGGGVARTATALGQMTKWAVEQYGPEGVYVLAASVRNLASGKSPLARLVQHHLDDTPVYVAGSDGEAVDRELIRGKLAILSFNAVKGCERPCVILVGLDELYFRYYDRAWPHADRIPNVLTVAATRASRQLVVVASGGTLRTVDTATLREHADVRGTVRPPRPAAVRAETRPRIVSVTDLVRHQHPVTVRTALQLVRARAERDGVARPPNPLKDKIKFGHYTEYVGNIYGVVATTLAEVTRTGTSSFAAGIDMPEIVETEAALEEARKEALEQGADCYCVTARTHASIPKEFWETLTTTLSIEPAARTPAEWTVLAVAAEMFDNGRWHLARQILDYDWVDEQGVACLGAVAIRLLDAAGAGRGEFEVPLPPAEVAGQVVVGRADYVESAGAVWEFKTGALSEEHELQLGCYLALRGGGEGVLASLARPETRRLTLDAASARAFLEILTTPPPLERRSAAEIVAEYDAAHTADDVTGELYDPDEEPGPSVEDLLDALDW